MLSKDTIEHLIQQIEERQESINTYVILVIAKRLREIGKLNASDVYKLERLLIMGNDVRLINEELARLALLQERDIKQLIKEAAKEAYVSVKPFYDYRHKPYIPFEKNIPLQRVVKAVEKQTLSTFKNLSNTKATGFLIRDLKHPGQLKFMPIGEAYISIIDEAIHASQSGVIDYGTATRNVMKQLIDSGVRKISWDSGYTQRLDTAVRRNIQDGIRQINQGVQDETGKQFGATGVELSVHAYPAPDHEPIQGHQFTMENYEKMQSHQPFEDVKGRQFPAMDRAIGELNCRHFAWNIVIGYATPNYTDEQLQQIIDRNHEGYTLPNGKHLTMYQCTQRQRKYETDIRRFKQGQMAAREAGNTELAKEYQAKINKSTSEYKQFSKACGLQTMMSKASVSGYRRISTK